MDSTGVCVSFVRRGRLTGMPSKRVVGSTGRQGRIIHEPLVITLSVVLPHLALGCDPGYDIAVEVVDKAGQPISGVQVQLDCPPAGLSRYEHHMALGTTDEKGRCAARGLGEVGLNCWIHAPTRSSKRLAVGASCVEEHPYLSICSRLSATLELPTSP